jgi:hypothetical protein
VPLLFFVYPSLTLAAPWIAKLEDYRSSDISP